MIGTTVDRVGMSMETVYRQQLLEEIKNTQELIREFWTSYGDLAEFLAQNGFFDRFFWIARPNAVHKTDNT